MSQSPHTQDLPRIVLGVIFIALLTTASLWVVQPFLGALIWATMVVVATWPMMIAIQKRLGGRRWLAVTIMTLMILLLLVIPLTLAVLTISNHYQDIANAISALATVRIPLPPDWIGQIPLVGKKIDTEWRILSSMAQVELAEKAAPYIRQLLAWFTAHMGAFGLMLLHFLVMLGISAYLYAKGELAAQGLRRFGRRLAGERGESSVILSAQAIRAVSLGVVVTAIAQTTAAGIGLEICGIPFAPVLTAIIFVLCIAQIGPTLVMVPAVIWLYWSGQPVWGTVLLVWAIIVGVMDNVLRPILIKRGADLPLPLILVGVIGGLIGFGIIGLFIGPVVLAVSYRLLQSWVVETSPDQSQPG